MENNVVMEPLKTVTRTRGKQKIKWTNKPLIAALVVIAILFVMIVGFFTAIGVSETFRNSLLGQFATKQTNGQNLLVASNDNQEDNSGTIGSIEKTKEQEDYVYMENLEEEVKLANETELYGFTAIVEQINGQQYLTFTNGVYKISYKNEKPTEESVADSYEVILSNGTLTKSFSWQYVMEQGNVAALCPRVGDYCGNEREQLVFSVKESKNSNANRLHVVSGSHFLEYYVIEPTAALENLITINAYLDAGQFILADITCDNRNYYISLPGCSLEDAQDNYAMTSNAKLTYEILEDSIQLQCFVTLGDGRYIGRIKGTMSYSSRDVFRLSSPSFYVFAEDDYCDVDSMGIVTPITESELYAARIPVIGNNGERLLIRAREELKENTYEVENFRLDEHGFLAYYENGVKTSLTGIDVSKWQYEIDWKKVAAAGVDYAMIRLGYRGTAAEGNCVIDPYFEKNIAGALEAGLQVGVYYFTQAITEEEAREEANIVIEALKGYDITFPVAYDTEYAENARANHLSNAERTACAKAFCDTIAAAGYTPVIYAGTNWGVLYFNLEEVAEYDLWYAYYGEPEDVYLPYSYTMWQYSDNSKVNGIQTNVDFNISFIDYSKQK